MTGRGAGHTARTIDNKHNVMCIIYARTQGGRDHVKIIINFDKISFDKVVHTTHTLFLHKQITKTQQNIKYSASSLVVPLFVFHNFKIFSHVNLLL